MKHLIIILFGILLLAPACNKKAAKYNPHFMGRWRTDVIEDTATGMLYRNEILIRSKRFAGFGLQCQDTCEENLCGCESSSFGRAMVTNFKHELVIGPSPHMKIDKEPYEVNGQWMMKLDGVVYYKE